MQKSGYFARSAAPDETDLLLIKSMTDYAVGCALRGISGVVGHDEDQNDQLRAIEFEPDRRRQEVRHRPAVVPRAARALRSTGPGGGAGALERPDTRPDTTETAGHPARRAAGCSGDFLLRSPHRPDLRGSTAVRGRPRRHPGPGFLRVRPGPASRLPGRPGRPVPRTRSLHRGAGSAGTRRTGRVGGHPVQEDDLPRRRRPPGGRRHLGGGPPRVAAARPAAVDDHRATARSARDRRRAGRDPDRQ